MKPDTLKQPLRRDLWIAVGPAALLIGLAFAVTFYFVKPAPPKSLVLAVVPDEGGFRYFGRRYQQFLAKYGVTVELRETKGSLSSIELLAKEKKDTAGADVAFVQGGVAGTEKAPGIVSLGSLSYEPLWVFYRGEPVDDVLGLKGRRIAVGPPGSGTRELALTLLHASGVDEAPTEVLPTERDTSIEELKQGRIDAVFLVAPAESTAIQKLATVPGLRLLSFARADAYVRRFPYLSKLVLPRGVFNLAADVPAQDVVLLAPTANLVARDSLHPALAYLLLRAASELHGGAGILDASGEFPAPRETGFPLSGEAKRYYKEGVPLLQRYLPFWVANLVDRLWVILVPIIAVVVPLARAVPALFQWRVRRRITRWYARLKEIEIQLEENPGRPLLEDMLRRLDDAEREVNRIPMPLAYADNLYSFREHIEVVRRRVLRKLASESLNEGPGVQAAG